MTLELVGLDADDTLWHNERLYEAGRRRFEAILERSAALNGHGLPANLDVVIHEIEVANLDYYGFGVTSFVMSLIETAVRVTGGRITGNEIAEIQAIAKQMIDAEVELYEAVEETLQVLSASYPLALITKGDLLHQTGKVTRSGIAHYFDAIEVVAVKDEATYARILDRLGVAPERFAMVGNSIRSDILPVVALGGWGVYVPNEGTWSYENTDLPADGANGRIRQATTMADVPALLSDIG